MSYIGKQPTKAPLTASDIEDGIITAAKIEDGAVVAAEIASNAVTTAKINADAVTGAKIADDAINSEHYTDGSIDTAHIAADQIVASLIADDAINSEHYTDGSVDTAHIADANVTTAKIADDAITAAKINNDIISGSTELATAPADTDEFLVSDAGTLKRIDYSLIKGGGAFEKISTTDLGDGSTASVQFNTLSTDYVDFRVVVTGLETVTHQEVFGVYVKRAGQSSFDTSSDNYLWGAHGMTANGQISADETGDTILKLHSSTLASQSGVNGASHNFIIDIFNPHDTWNKKFISSISTFTEGTYGRNAAQQGAGYRNSLEAIIGLEFLMTGGTMSRGVFTLYGRKQ